MFIFQPFSIVECFNIYWWGPWPSHALICSNLNVSLTPALFERYYIHVPIMLYISFFLPRSTTFGRSPQWSSWLAPPGILERPCCPIVSIHCWCFVLAQVLCCPPLSYTSKGIGSHLRWNCLTLSSLHTHHLTPHILAFFDWCWSRFFTTLSSHTFGKFTSWARVLAMTSSTTVLQDFVKYLGSKPGTQI